jgi:RimJ/RimL family protein N-acetyltransferase
MLIWDSPDVINDWIASQGGGRAHPGKCSALGWTENGRLVAGLVFHDSNGSHCLVNIALVGKRFPIGLLKAGLMYVFHQLQLKRLTFIIAETNIASQNLCAQLGAKPEATLREADINGGNLLIYALFPADCKIWSRLNGKICGHSPDSA